MNTRVLIQWARSIVAGSCARWCNRNAMNAASTPKIAPDAPTLTLAGFHASETRKPQSPRGEINAEECRVTVQLAPEASGIEQHPHVRQQMQGIGVNELRGE